jgi:nitrite reductase/ring-hydroxylating ferredoxin subunit
MVKIFSSLEEATKAIPKRGLRLLIIDGKKIAITHTDEGLYAFDNACPHQNEPLNKGSININNEVVCRLHEYRYNLITGKESGNQCGPLTIYQIHSNDSGVYLDL